MTGIDTTAKRAAAMSRGERSVDTHGVSDAEAAYKMTADRRNSEAQVRRRALPERSVDTHGVSDAEAAYKMTRQTGVTAKRRRGEEPCRSAAPIRTE
jgi:hypothetical protein